MERRAQEKRGNLFCLLSDTLYFFYLYLFLCNKHILILYSVQAHDALCDYVQVPCVHSECSERVSRANLAEHLEKTCHYRMEKCEHCKSPVIFAVMKVILVNLMSPFHLFMLSYMSLSCTLVMALYQRKA